MYRLALTAVMTTLLATMSALTADNTSASETLPEARLVGTWTLVLVDNVFPDGRRVHPYGANPQGLLIFDAKGRYALQILGTDRPRFASNDKSKGTPAEYAAAIQGSNAHFGRYSLNAADGTITFQIEHASFPNWEGTQQKRSFALKNDVLKYTVPTTTSGDAVIGEVQWQRAE